MIEEVDVLLRVQGLQEGRGRVALVALAHLVDLVEHDHRVHHLDVLERLHQLAGQGADVGAAVALDLGFVAHAADAEAVERPAEGFGDGLADAGLAHTGRADQQHDAAGDLALEGADGEELASARLSVYEPDDFAHFLWLYTSQHQLLLISYARHDHPWVISLRQC